MVITKGHLVKQNKSQFGFAHLAIIAIISAVAIVGLVGYVVWQNISHTNSNSTASNSSSSKTTTTEVIKTENDPYENWKTYTNATYGFSFKYPSDWSIKESPSSVSNSIGTPTPAVEAINPNSDDFRAVIHPVDIGGWGFEQDFSSISYNSSLSSGKIILSERRRYEGSEGSYLISARYFDYENYRYMIFAAGDDSSRMDSADITFNQIISSWQFK